MAIAIRTSSSAFSDGGVSTYTITAPAGIVAGDFLLFIAQADTDTSQVALVGPPSGSWTSTGGWFDASSAGGGSNIKTWYRWADGTDAGKSWTITVNTGSGNTAEIIAFTGVNTTTPLAATPTGTSSTSTTPSTSIPAPSITPTVANAFVVFAYGQKQTQSTGATYTPPGGTTKLIDRASGTTNYLSTGISYRQLSSAANVATGTTTFTSTLSKRWTAATVALNPAVTVPSFVAATVEAHASPTAGGTFNVTSASFTPNAGDLLVVKAAGGYTGITPSSVGDSQTLSWTQAATANNGGTITTIWTATATAATSMAVSVGFTASLVGTSYRGSMIVERYANAQVGSGLSQVAASANTATITPSMAGSIITWSNSDFTGTATAPTAAAGTVTGYGQNSGQESAYYGYQTSTGTSAQTYGVTSPISSRSALAAIELVLLGSSTTWTGAATLAAVSSASFSGPAETAAADATLAGSSGLTASAGGVLGAAAALAGASGTTANATRGLAAAMTTGSTSGMAIGTPATGIGMVFSATSGMTATAGAVEQAQASLAGTSGTTASANIAAKAAATLAAVSGMSLGPTAIEKSAATFSSTSGSTFTAQVTMQAALATGSSSGSTFTARMTASVSATFSGTSGSSFTAGWPIAPGAAVLSAVSAFSAQGALGAQAQSIFVGVSTSTFAPDEKYTPPFIRPGGPVVPPVKTPRMRLLVANTMTGRINYELPWDTLSWNSPLNAAGTMNAEIVVEAMLDSVYQQGEDDPATVLREFLTGPWRWSLAVAYGNDVLWAGPYLPSQDPPDKSTVTIQGVQLEKMFDRRLVYGGPGGDSWNDPSYDLKFTGTTLPGLVYSLVENAITPNTFSPNRTLPITCANPPAMVGKEQRTYYSYDLATTSKAISDVVTADGGPDWRLDPYLVQGSDGNYLRWELRIGNPTIDTSPIYTWDDTLALVQRDIDASAMATSVWVPGNGQDRDKLIGWESVGNTPFTLAGRGFPSLETVDGQHSSETDFDKLVSWATADLASGAQAVDTWTLKVPVDADPPAGAYRSGDVAGVDIARHRAITPGSYRRRITELSGDGSTSIQIVCGDADGAPTG